MPKSYLATDGKLVLKIQPVEKGWYTVTCPFNPEIITQARTIQECFLMAHDAEKALAKAHRILRRRTRTQSKPPRKRR